MNGIFFDRLPFQNFGNSICVFSGDNKMERLSIGPLGICFRKISSGDKGIKVNDQFFSWIAGSKLKPSLSFSREIKKLKDFQLEPLGSAFAD